MTSPSAASGPANPDRVPEVLWRPNDAQRANARITGFAECVAQRTGAAFPDYDSLWRYSVADVTDFWRDIVDYFDIPWHTAPAAGAAGAAGVLADVSMPGARWFPGATLNYAEIVLRAGNGRSDDDSAVLETDESGHERSVTLGELRAMVGAAQAGLRRLGVTRGDRVAALAPNRLEALVAFLATAALGGVWSSCSPEFGAHSVIDRFTQISPTVLIVVDGYRYGGKLFDISETVAQIREALPELAATVQIPSLGKDATGNDGPRNVDTGIPSTQKTLTWSELVAEPSEPEFVPVEFNDPLWVLYSSGTTGLPKPIVQSVGGIVVEHVKTLALHHDLGPGDTFFWFTTTGWMMWNLLVGGLLVGSTVVLYDGSPAYPDLSALWQLIDRHRIGYAGVSAAFISSCRAAETNPTAGLDLSCVTVLGSTGSPLSTDGFDWIMEHVGPQTQIASLSGGTDLCTAIVGAAPTVPVWRGEISARALGAKVEAFDPAGNPLTDQVGELVLTAPMPSMPVFFWGDDDGSRMSDAYFDMYPGVWRHGDWIRITSRGSCVIEGRSDATLNRGGIRMGTAEFYRVTESVAGIVDSLVIDTSSATAEGELVLFAVVDDNADMTELQQRVGRVIRSELSPRHVPNRFVAVPAIPRTINGKKCEVPVKRIMAGAAVDHVISRDALADPAAFDAFVAAAVGPDHSV